MKNKEIVIMTHEFPYGESESFLSPEIEILANEFEYIKIIPLRLDKTKKLRSLPKNASVVELNGELTDYTKRTIYDYFLLSKIFILEFLYSGKLKILKNSRYHLSELFVYLEIAKKINALQKKGVLNKTKSIYYSYWFDAGASALLLFKRLYRIDACIISRAHGFDLYEERNERGYIFPRELQVRYINKVYSISEDGKEYLIKAHPKLKDKIECSRLGTVMSKSLKQDKRTNGEEILIVSCAYLIPIKRVNKIIEILSFCKSPIKWVHFGDGPLKRDLVELSRRLPSNINVEFRGNVNNSSILDFYEENEVNWFINVSGSEGIPVSIMEAISFGIPIIATNVGGTKEIVNEITGTLIDKEFSPELVAKIIEEKNTSKYQKEKIVAFWAENYNAIKNFSSFSANISKFDCNEN